VYAFLGVPSECLLEIVQKIRNRHCAEAEGQFWNPGEGGCLPLEAATNQHSHSESDL
jgi:hypothetical protein